MQMVVVLVMYVLQFHHRKSLGLTVQSDSNFGIVVSVGKLPYVKSLSWGIRKETEEQNDGVRWWQSIWMDLPNRVNRK